MFDVLGDTEVLTQPQTQRHVTSHRLAEGQL